MMRRLQFAELTVEDLWTGEVAFARMKTRRKDAPVRLQKDPSQPPDVFPKDGAIPFTQCGACDDGVFPVSRQCGHHVVRVPQPWRAVGVGKGLSGTDFLHVRRWMQIVRIDECPPERVRQRFAYGRLARACGAHQHNNHQPSTPLEHATIRRCASRAPGTILNAP